MYVLGHFDWFGSIVDLEKLEEQLKKLWDDSDKVKFLGRFSPQNKKFHWTWFIKAKDMNAWANRKTLDFSRDYKILTHHIWEFYGN